MSSGGQILGGIGGAIIGGLLGGPTGALYGAQIGITAGGIIDPPKGPNQTGPRLDDLSMQGASYGSAIPRVYGTVAMAGTVVWLENNELKEVSKKTTQGGKGGPSTTTTTYSYYATFALAICQGPITGVRRIWAGANLIYDAGSNDIETVIASNSTAEGFRLHLGAADQQPDERMQATLGVDCPAHRGIAYIVFDDFALADYNNNLAATQFKVEVISSGSTARNAISAGDVTITSDAPAVVYRYNDGVINAVRMGRYWGTSGSAEGYYSETYRLGMDLAISTFVPTDRPSPAGVPPGQNLVTGHPDEYFATTGFPPGMSHFGDGGNFACPAEVTRPSYLDLVWRVDGVARRGDSYYTVVQDPVGSPVIDLYKFRTLVMAENNEYRTPSSSGTVSVRTHDESDYVVMHSDYLWRVSDGAAVGSVVFDVDLNVVLEVPVGVVAALIGVIGNTVCYVSGSAFKLADLPAFDNVRTYAWGAAFPTVATQSWPAYVAPGLVTYRGAFYVLSEGAADATVPLADIIATECARSAILQPGDYDTSDLADEVRGYRVGSIGSLRAAIEPLQGAFPFDVVQSGYTIRFKRRGSAAVLSFSADELDARAFGSAAGVSQVIAREMDTQLPAKVTVKYLDADREYDIGSQYAERLGTQSGNETTIDMPLVLTSNEAAKAAQVLISMYWLERTEFGPYRLPPTARAIEPGDVVTIGGRDVRVRDITLESDGRVTVSGKDAAPFARVYVSSAVGATGDVTGKSLPLSGPSYAVLIDGPSITEEMDRGGFIGAVCGITSGWRSGALANSGDGGQTWTVKHGFADAVPIGQTITALRGDVDERAIDTQSHIAVRMISGALTSVTLASLFGGANLFAIGAHGRWEIVAVQNCVLQGDGTYLLSTMLRGRFGTEHAMALHSAGDHVVMISDADAAVISVPTSSIGSASLWRAVTTGRSVDTAADITFTYDGENLRPLSPAYLRAIRNASSREWSLDWYRRERIDAWWPNTGSVGMSEAEERYEIDISASAGGPVLRTIEATSTSATYTLAQQLEDASGPISTISAAVYQISSIVGRGRAAIVTTTQSAVPPTQTALWDGMTGQNDLAVVAVANSKIIIVSHGIKAADTSKRIDRYWASSDGIAFTQIGADVEYTKTAEIDAKNSTFWREEPGAVAVLSSGEWIAYNRSQRRDADYNLQTASWSILKGSDTAVGARLGPKFMTTTYPLGLASDGTNVIALTENKHIYTTTDGSTWTDSGSISGISETLELDVYGLVNGKRFELLRVTGGWLVQVGSKVYRTTSAGATSGWSVVLDIAAVTGYSSSECYQLSRALVDGTTVFVATKTTSDNRLRIYKSTDSGATWALDYSVDIATLGSIGSDIQYAAKIGSYYCWVGGYGGKLLRMSGSTYSAVALSGVAGAIGRIASLASTSVSVEFIDSGLRSGDGAAWSSIYAG